MKQPFRPDSQRLPEPQPIPSRIDVFLRPGEWEVGDRRYRFHTLLGSCVSITLWHPHQKVGAMSHFLLASRMRHRATDAPASPLDGRYGDEALALMLDGLRARGIDPSQCVAKVFGGGDMFPALAGAMPEGIGRRNGEAARLMLEGWAIAVSSESLFGIGHRKIIFDVENGHVWARQADPAAPNASLPKGQP